MYVCACVSVCVYVCVCVVAKVSLCCDYSVGVGIDIAFQSCYSEWNTGVNPQWYYTLDQAMKVVDLANCCLKEVAKHAGGPHMQEALIGI